MVKKLYVEFLQFSKGRDNIFFLFIRINWAPESTRGSCDGATELPKYLSKGMKF